MDDSKIYYQDFLSALDELGFCTMRVFNDEQLSNLRTLYEENFGAQRVNGLYASHNSNPIEHTLAVNEGIKKIVEETLQDIFPNYHYFIGHFMVKGASTTDVFRLHQDWNIVDEKKYKSYQIWIPLQLTYPANGGLFVVPGSHRFFENQRSGSYTIPSISEDKFPAFLKADIIVPPGNVLIYHNALFHGSYANQTDEPRLAVIVNFVEKEAPTFYFQKNENENRTDLYFLDGESLLRNLPELEKGGVGNLVQADIFGFNPINNQELSFIHLQEKYKAMFGHVQAQHVKQLHIAVQKELEDKMNRDGYAVVDLLDKNEIQTLKDEYHVHFGNLEPTPGRFLTLLHVDASLKKRIHEFIIKATDKALRKYFKDFLVPVALFYTKKAHTSGDIDLHADTTLLVNHQLEPHYAIWIPLLDVDVNNGTLTVVPQSHHVGNAIFGKSTGGYHAEHMNWLREKEVPLKLNAGQAIIFDNNLLHNSTANNTTVDRVCVTLRLTHKHSAYYSYIGKDDGSIDVVEEASNYYMKDDWDGDSFRSSGIPKGTMSHTSRNMTKAELEKILIHTME